MPEEASQAAAQSGTPVRTRSAWLNATLVIASAGACALYSLRTFDVFFHLAAGRYMQEHWALLDHDVFSSTFRGHVWDNHGPLAELALWALESTFGLFAVPLLAVCASAVCVAAAWLSLRDQQLLSPASAFLLLPPVWALRSVLSPRPHVIGFAALALTLWWMQRWLREGARSHERGHAYALFSLLPTQWVWIGSHGSHLLFPLLASVLCVSTQLARDRARRASAVYFCAAAWASVFVLARSSLRLEEQHLESSYLRTQIPEWFPLTAADLVQNPAGWLYLLSVVGTLLGLLRSMRSRSARTWSAERWFQLGAALGLIALSTGARRMLALWLLSVTPLWAPLCSKALRPLAERVGRHTQRWLGWLPLAAAVASVHVCAYDAELKPGLGVQWDRLPVDAVRRMRELQLDGPVYNAQNWGGYLMHESYPPAGVFVDGRVITLYPPEFLERFARAYDDAATFEALAAQYGAQSVLMPQHSQKTSKLLRYLRSASRWRLVYEDTVAVLYTRAAQ